MAAVSYPNLAFVAPHASGDRWCLTATHQNDPLPLPRFHPKADSPELEAWQPAAVAWQSIHAARISKSWRDERELAAECAATRRRCLAAAEMGRWALYAHLRPSCRLSSTTAWPATCSERA